MPYDTETRGLIEWLLEFAPRPIRIALTLTLLAIVVALLLWAIWGLLH